MRGEEMKFLRPLPELEQEELVIKAKTDPDAREKIILHNLRLVYKTARKYVNARTEIDDLFQSGVFGLMVAIEKYDPSRGAKFSTYAVWAIQSSITRNKANFTQGDVSLSEPVIDGEDITVGDKIPDNVVPIEETIGDKIIEEQLRGVVDKNLNAEAKEILYKRYGFYGRTYTLAEIAREKGKSAERIRRISHDATRKLYRTQFIQELKKERAIDRKTSFVKGRDYSQPIPKNRSFESMVESLVIHREWLRSLEF